jgi:hypothetical protein
MTDVNEISVTDVISTDFGQSVVYDEPLSDESIEHYNERLEDYADAQAEAEARQQYLSAG